jgi:amino-acid N-acetyltransferase
MSAELVPRPRTSPAGSPGRRSRIDRTLPRLAFRSATTAEAPMLHRLIAAHAEEGRLLPRHPDELAAHAPRFVVAVRRGVIVGCAELAPLASHVAEVRSLVVTRPARGMGIGTELVRQLRERAEIAGLETLCAFTHDAAYFVRLGFAIVPHATVPEKIAHDCVSCPQFGRCGQHAVVLSLDASRTKTNPVAAARG